MAAVKRAYHYSMRLNCTTRIYTVTQFLLLSTLFSFLKYNPTVFFLDFFLLSFLFIIKNWERASPVHVSWDKIHEDTRTEINVY